MILIDGNSKEPVTDDLLHLNNNHLLGFDETEPQIILWAPLQQTVDFICCVLVLVCFFFSGGEGPHPFAYLHPGSDFFAGGGRQSILQPLMHLVVRDSQVRNELMRLQQHREVLMREPI